MCKCNHKCNCGDSIIRNYVVPKEGQPGKTPYIGVNKNWWIDGLDTGISSIGNSTTYRFSVNNSSTIPPVISNVINPLNWTTSPTSIQLGEYRWSVFGIINSNNELIGNWSEAFLDNYIDSSEDTIYRYAINNSNTIPPTITNILNPVGWQESPQELNSGEYRWVVQSIKNSNNELLTNWSTPVIDGFIDVSAPESDDDVFDI